MSVHGWPDGEARPMPYGATLAQGSNIHVPASGNVVVGALETGAWPAVALAVEAFGNEVYVVLEYEFIDAVGVTTPNYAAFHPGDRSVVLAPTWGHRVTACTIVADPFSIISYVIAGANQGAGLDSERVRVVTVPDDLGGTSVDLYTTRPGIQSRIVRAVVSIILPTDPADPGTTFTNYDLVRLTATDARSAATATMAFVYPDRNPRGNPAYTVNTVLSAYPDAFEAYGDGDADLSWDGATTVTSEHVAVLDSRVLAPGTTVTLEHVRPGTQKTPPGTGYNPYLAPLVTDQLASIALHVAERIVAP